MRILQLSTFNAQYGAAIAARRLNELLNAEGVESRLFVRDVLSPTRNTSGITGGLAKFVSKVHRRLDELPLHFYGTPTGGFSLNWLSNGIVARVRRAQADVVHLHWCQSGFVPTPAIPKLGDRVVMTLHDMWAFTGGCHYAGECTRYMEACGKCPALESSRGWDISRFIHGQKQRAYATVANSLHLISPSRWLASVASQSPLFRDIPITVIPNPLDTTIFKPLDKSAVRKIFNLPDRVPLVLFGKAKGEDHRKGFSLLEEALDKGQEMPDMPKPELVVLGADEVRLSPAFRVHALGFVHDESALAALYNAVDAVVLPSREENYSNILSEALACGTPCLAFNVGGNGDLITSKSNGYLAQPFDPDDLAHGLKWILANSSAGWRDAIAKESCARLDRKLLAAKFMEVYNAGRASFSGR